MFVVHYKLQELLIGPFFVQEAVNAVTVNIA